MWKWIALAVTAGCSPAADDVTTPADPAPPERVECPEGRDARFDALAARIEAERVALGAPGVAVAVMLDGKLAWCEGFGSRSPDGGAAMGPHTLLRIGSVTKVLTATALLQEVEQGTLALDATVPGILGADWQFAIDGSWADQLRVDHLLTHQGGMVDYLEIDAARGAGALAEWVDGWMLDYLYLMAPPGSFFNYSNPNWSVAGRLIEHGSDTAYVPRMASLFEALGMERTVFRSADVLADGDYATGDTWDWGGAPVRVEVQPDDYDNAWARPAGYAWSSVEDLAAFAAFLMRGDDAVLEEALRLEMLEPQVSMGGVPGLSHYGYGLMVQEGAFLDSGFHPRRWITHGGAIPGYSAEIHLIPDQGFAMITLANGDGAYLTESLHEAFSTLVDLPAPTAGPDLTPPDPGRYVGTYHDPFNVGTWIFSLDAEGRLVMDMPLLDQLSIPYAPVAQPLYGDSFYIEVQGYPMELTFIDEGGSPRWARTRFFVAERDEPGAHARSHRAERRGGLPLHPDPDRLRARLAEPHEPLPPAMRLLQRARSWQVP